jgi:hypothetical protein
MLSLNKLLKIIHQKIMFTIIVNTILKTILITIEGQNKNVIFMA